MVGGWSRDDKRAGTKVSSGARRARIGRRDQAQAWVEARVLHPRASRGVRGPALARDEAPAGPVRELVGPRPWTQRTPDRPRGAPARSPPRGRAPRGRRRAHPEAEEALRGARMRTSRKPSAVARERCASFPAPAAGAGDGARSRAARTGSRTGRRARPRARRGAGLAGAQLDLPGTEGDPAARLQLDDQVPQWVDPSRNSAAVLRAGRSAFPPRPHVRAAHRARRTRRAPGPAAPRSTLRAGR